KIGLIADQSKLARKSAQILKQKYHFAKTSQADILIVLGGDGFMLRQLHNFFATGQKLYGINCGTIGFLMNQFEVSLTHLDDLEQRILNADETKVHPLFMESETRLDKKVKQNYAFNEVVLSRQNQQAAHINIKIDRVTAIERLICDGVMVATPAGSTAYNLAVNGPILPFGSDVVALSAISPFRPRRWNGAILKDTRHITITAQDTQKRPVNADADSVRVSDVRMISVSKITDRWSSLLFDPDKTLEERIFKEQFTTV
ncbi:MAG: NAD kinase, partial [Pseudomonadota bacterium]